MLQAFHWESHETYPWWNIVTLKAQDISSAGFNMVWLPPSGRSSSEEGYLPNEYYNQNSFYGSYSDLKAAIQKLHDSNIKVIADIVINHRVGLKGWADFENPKWGPDAVTSNDEWGLGTGAPDSGLNFEAGRDLDHYNPIVRADIIAWMKWLKSEIGYDGWRYDFVKGYAGKFVDLYNTETKPYFSVGEYWSDYNPHDTNPSRQKIVNWLDEAKGNSYAFDFTTKDILGDAVRFSEYWRLKDSQGKPSGLIGWWAGRAVTFIDNHDTGPSLGGNGGQNQNPFPDDKIMQGYAYILTHPGVPCVYWLHFFDWPKNIREEITKLIQIRKQYGINSESSVTILFADNSKYVARIDDKLIVKIGWGIYTPSKEYKVIQLGKDYTIWLQGIRKK